MYHEKQPGDFNPADDRMDRAMEHYANELHKLPVSELIAIAMKHEPESVRDRLQHKAADATFDRLKVAPDKDFAGALQTYLTDGAIRDVLMHAELVLAYMEDQKRAA